MSKPLLLYVGDATVQTGFGRGNERIIRALMEEWDVHVLAINATGDPYPPMKDVPLYPAMLSGDAFGVRRIQELNEKLEPQLIILTNDSWNIGLYLQQLPEKHAPIIAYMPVDAPNQWMAPILSTRIQMAVTPTMFGITELQHSGYLGPQAVIPYGVDPLIYTPLNREAIRKSFSREANLKLKDGFVVQVVARNTTRKRIDLVLQYFAEWWNKLRRSENVYLMLHTNPDDPPGYALTRIATHLGIQSQIILTAQNFNVRHCLSEQDLCRIYNAADVHVNLVHEGWGLCTMESMACGVPQICIDYAALGEWPKGVASYVPVSGTYYMAGPIATVAPIPDKTAVLAELTRHYDMPLLDRQALGAACRQRVLEERFSWYDIGQRWLALAREVANERQ